MTELPWPAGAPLFASGTDALAALLRWGASWNGWSRVWLPSYYCPDVPAALRAFAGVEVLTYPDHDLCAVPDPAAAGPARGDVVVVANQLGIRRAPAIDELARSGVVVIDDHSHDPASAWAYASTAHYAFASLRKTLPIPDGGVVWSPRGLDLPAEPPSAGGASADRLATAVERRGHPPGAIADDRLRLRALARVSATPSTTSPPGAPERPGISPVSRALLAQMPVRTWRERRRANLQILTRAIATVDNVRVLTAAEDGVAFALTLVFDTAAARAGIRDALTARAVASSVLWPLDPSRDPGARDGDADLSRRILSINADQRFGAGDMAVLARILQAALREV